MSLVCAATAVYSMPYMRHRFDDLYGSERNRQYGVYYLNFLLVVTGLLGVSLSTNLIELYLFVELMLIPTFFLLGLFGYVQKGRVAIMYFVWNQLGAFIFLVGILVAYSSTGSFAVSSLSTLGTGSSLGVLGLLPRHARLVRQDGGLRRPHVAPDRRGRAAVLVRPDNGDRRGRRELRRGEAPRPEHADHLPDLLRPLHDSRAPHDDLRRGDDPGPGRRQVPLRVVDDEPERLLPPRDREPHRPRRLGRGLLLPQPHPRQVHPLLRRGDPPRQDGDARHEADGRAREQDAAHRRPLPHRGARPLGGAADERVPGGMDNVHRHLLPGRLRRQRQPPDRRPGHRRHRADGRVHLLAGQEDLLRGPPGAPPERHRGAARR